jgi:hypothetical protein
MRKGLVLLMVCSSIGSAFGYINPGTGTVIAGSLWPVIVAFFSSIFALLVRYFWTPINEEVIVDG